MIPVVLSIDDDKVTQLLNKMILERVGFCEKVVPLMDGQEALQWLHQAAINAFPAPAIILLDLNMPVMNGWDFLDAFEHIKNSFAAANIVVLSSSINPDDESKALGNSRVISYLTKPLTIEMIENLKQHPALQQCF